MTSASSTRNLIVLAAFQTLCALVFVGEFLTEVLGLRTWALPFAWREIMQLLASLGLVSGALISMHLLRKSRLKLNRMQQQLRAASGDFQAVMTEFFDDWGLSASERDVAMFAVRGYSNPDIATLRGTSEATIKSQINAIFRKAQVSNRAQLVGLFVDALFEAEAVVKTGS